MKRLTAALLAAAATGLTLVPAPATAQTAAAQQGKPTVPVEAWSLRDVMPTVQISPDGKHLLLLKLESKEGEYLLQIADTDNLSGKPITTNADPMEIIGASWVNDRYIFGTAWQESRKSVKRPEQNHRDFASFSFDIETKKFKLIRGDFSVANLLPNDPDHILIRSVREVDGGSGVDPFAAFRPRSYYKFNLETGAQSLVLKGNEKFPTASFDDEGNPRFTTSFDPNTREQKFYYRKPGDGSWTEVEGMNYDLDNAENLYRVLGGFQGFQGFKQGDPNTGYFIDNPEGDKAALYEFDFNTGKLGKKLYENPDADVMGIQTSSMAWAGDNKMVAARYPGAKRERHWFDETEKALFENLESEIPNAHSVSIGSRSRDGSTMVVHNIGPRDPGSWWLVRDNTMVKIGSRNPTLDADDLTDVEYIRYKARDGLTIPAYLMKPKGEGPFPLVVQHNGGPHVNGVVGYDEWGQMLANNGYAVLRPQNRISTGWGQAHFDAGNGEHGLKMQDDKDDGALYLVEQGIADPDRIAFFGWSYGGYAALVAASREDNIYQCTIAGAAVADAEKVYLKRRSTRFGKALDEWGRNRGSTTINPINEVDKVNIPLLMVHGDVDARVMYFNFEDYKKAIEKAGKTDAQFMTLKGLDHNNLMYDHQLKFHTKMLDFLANDCGPGGL